MYGTGMGALSANAKFILKVMIANGGECVITGGVNRLIKSESPDRNGRHSLMCRYNTLQLLLDHGVIERIEGDLYAITEEGEKSSKTERWPNAISIADLRVRIANNRRKRLEKEGSSLMR